MEVRILILLLLIAPVCLTAREGWLLETASAEWAGRSDHNLESFDGKLWIFNGEFGASPPPLTNVIWSSENGSDWVDEGSIPWVFARWGAASLVFDGKMWMICGKGWNYESDVWSTEDGVNWTTETTFAFAGRASHAAVVFNGRMWVLGGRRGNEMLNDVWSSDDGQSWFPATMSAPWPARAEHVAFVFDNRLWITGGGDGVGGAGPFSDVWSSPDGASWTLETALGPWGRAWGDHNAEVYNGRVFLFGGSKGNFVDPYVHDVWVSSDGTNWQQWAHSIPWQGRRSFASVVFNGRIWLAGGRNKLAAYNHDVWSYGFHFSPDVLPDGVIDEPYAAALEAREGQGPYHWEFVAMALPPGLSLDTSGTSETVSISGVPAQTGQFAFIVRVTDNNGLVAEQPIAITIHPPPKPPDRSKGGSGCALAGAWAFGPYVLVVAAPAIAAYALSRRRRRCLRDER
jgi:hypothetical protein